MAFEAGTVYVPIVPSLRGFQQRISREIGGAGGAAGREFGRQFAQPAGDEAARGLRGALGRLNGVMSAVGVGAGAAFAGALVKAVDLSAAQGRLQAQLGLTRQESARVGAVAGRLYAQAYGESMDDVRAAITSVIQHMDGMRDASAESLQETTRRAMVVAEVMGEDVGEVTRSVAQIMRTGLAKNAQEAFDILTRGTQIGGNAAKDLLDTFTEYSTQFRNMGLTGQQAMGLITQGLRAGARDADVVADAIKEFSIEAVAGGDRVMAGFRDLGLDAEQMSQALAAGGPTAARAFDLVLDKLRAVKDPVQRNAIAVELFGTKAEDLGQALYALDLSSAEQAMNGLGGATDRAGQAMQQTAAAKITAFKRSLETGITNVVANDVLPVLDRLKGAGETVGISPERVVQGTLVLGGLAAAFRGVSVASGVATAGVARFRAVTGAAGVAGFVTGLRNANAAMAANATTATRLGAALRSQVLLWRQQAAAAGVSTARIIAQAAAQRVAAVATRVWAAAQAVFNAVMSANPIALIVIGIAALIAAVVLAYQRFAWFRNLVDTVWSGIKTAFTAAWDAIRPVLVQIGHWLSGVLATAFQWLANTARTVWTGLTTAASAAWAVLQPIFSTIVNVVRAVLGVAFTVFANTVKIAWIAIQLQIKASWAVIRVVFAALRAFVANVLGPVFRWLWNNIVKPVWNAIRSHISTVWAGIRAIWNALRSYLSGPLSAAFRTARSVIQTVWNAVRNTISTVYNNGIRPTFDKLRSAVGRVRDAFRTAVNGIRKIWDGLRDATKKPVNFVIGIYNDGIVRLVNRIADVAGLKTRLHEIPKFARGGIMPGYKPGVDELIAAVSPGEAIMRPEFTRAVGEGFIHKANDVARRSGVEGVRRWLTGADAIGGEGLAFARGGVVPRFAGAFRFGGIIGRFVDGVKNFTIGNVGKAARGLLDKILGGAVPGAGIIRDVVAQIPSWIKDTVLKWVTSKVDSGVGGPAVQRALRFAKAQAGKPYIWGGVGPGGYDCSGFMSAITNVIQGKNPYSRRFTTFSFTGASRGPAGFVRNLRSGFVVGVTNAGVGHMAGTLGGVNVESRGSAGVVVGPRARGASDGLFSMRYGLKFDRGGLLPQGLTLAYHGARQPDRVLTDSQWQAIYAAARGSDAPTTTYNVYPRTLDMTVEDLDRLTRVQAARARVGRPR